MNENCRDCVFYRFGYEHSKFCSARQKIIFDDDNTKRCELKIEKETRYINSY